MSIVMNAIAQIFYNSTGDNRISDYLPPVNIAGALPDLLTQTYSSSGDHSVPCRTTDSQIFIIPPTDNTTVTLKLKGASGDTGVSLPGNSPSVIGVDGQTSIIINTSDAITVLIIRI